MWDEKFKPSQAKCFCHKEGQLLLIVLQVSTDNNSQFSFKHGRPAPTWYRTTTLWWPIDWPNAHVTVFQGQPFHWFETGMVLDSRRDYSPDECLRSDGFGREFSARANRNFSFSAVTDSFQWKQICSSVFRLKPESLWPIYIRIMYKSYLKI